MNYKQLIIGIAIGLVTGVGAGVVVAQEGEKSYEAKVVHRTEAPERQVGGGKAVATLMAEGKEAYVGRLKIAPGAKVPEHRDATEEFLYVLFGGGKINIDDKSYDLKPGHLVYMPANAKVSYENGDKTTKVLQIFAGPEPVKKYDKWEPVE